MRSPHHTYLTVEHCSKAYAHLMIGTYGPHKQHINHPARSRQKSNDVKQAIEQKQPTCKTDMQTNNPQGFKLNNLYELTQGPGINVCPLGRGPKQQTTTQHNYNIWLTASRGDGHNDPSGVLRPKNVMPVPQTFNVSLNALHLPDVVPNLWFHHPRT